MSAATRVTATYARKKSASMPLDASQSSQSFDALSQDTSASAPLLGDELACDLYDDDYYFVKKKAKTTNVRKSSSASTSSASSGAARRQTRNNAKNVAGRSAHRGADTSVFDTFDDETSSLQSTRSNSSSFLDSFLDADDDDEEAFEFRSPVATADSGVVSRRQSSVTMSKRRVSVSRTRRVSDDGASMTSNDEEHISAALVRELGESRHKVEQLQYVLDGMAARHSDALRLASLQEFVEFCEQFEYRTALRMQSNSAVDANNASASSLSPMATAFACLTQLMQHSNENMMTLAACACISLLNEVNVLDSTDCLKAIVAMQSVDSPAHTAVASEQDTTKVVKRKVSLLRPMKRKVDTVAQSDNGIKLRAKLRQHLENCSRWNKSLLVLNVDIDRDLCNDAIPIRTSLSLLGTIVLCDTVSQLERASMRNVLLSSGAVDGIRRRFHSLVTEIKSIDSVCGLTAMQLSLMTRFFERATFDCIATQLELINADCSFVDDSAALLQVLWSADNTSTTTTQRELALACVRPLLNVSNHNELGAAALFARPTLLQAVVFALTTPHASDDSDHYWFDVQMSLLALLINCVETSVERCETLQQTTLSMSNESVVALLVQLLFQVGDWQSIRAAGEQNDDQQTEQDAERVDKRVLQSYIVMLLGCLCRSGDCREELEKLLPNSEENDGISSLITLARLLERFLQFQLRNGLLTADVHREGVIVAKRLRNEFENN